MTEEKKEKINGISSNRQAEGQVIDSKDLFGNSHLILIRHNSDLYRLMITKQGKLILTK
jgi:hemin uptake protein HemP